MIKNNITSVMIGVLTFFLLGGCSFDAKNYFKKSANNKYIDTKGFKGGKRRPLYNNKYINLAKKNIVEENEDDDEIEDENDLYSVQSTGKAYRNIYMEMIKQDINKQEIDAKNKITPPPTLISAHNKMATEKKDNQELQKELSEIKSLLNEARNDLAKYKCSK